MRATIVIKPSKKGAGETLMKSVKLDEDHLPDEGSLFKIRALNRDVTVKKVDTVSPEPEIHCVRTLAIDESHRLKSLGWRSV